MPERSTLHGARYDEVSFVDRGGNNSADPNELDGAHIVIFKRDGEPVSKDMPDVGDVHSKAPIGAICPACNLKVPAGMSICPKCETPIKASKAKKNDDVLLPDDDDLEELGKADGSDDSDDSDSSDSDGSDSDDDDDELTPEQMLQGLDAIIDEMNDLVKDQDLSTLPEWAGQALSLAGTADMVSDALMDALSVYDPDDADDNSDSDSGSTPTSKREETMPENPTRPDLEGLAPEVRAYIESLEAEGVGKSDESGTDDVYKGIDPAVAAVLRKRDAEHAAELSKAQEQVAELEKRDAISKMESVAVEHGLAKADAATLYEAKAALGNDNFNKVLGLMSGLRKQDQTAALFAEFGKSADDGASPNAEALIDAEAREIAKAENISYAKAYAKVLDAHPHLYQQGGKIAGSEE